MKLLHLTVILAAGALLLHGCAGIQPISANSTLENTSAEETPSALDNYIASRRLAWEAAVMVQNPPHSVNTWQEAKVKWRRAIRLLEKIPSDSDVFQQAKDKLTTYQTNYKAIDTRLTAEQNAENQLEAAQTAAWQAAVTVQNPPHSLKVWQRASQKWEEAIGLIEQIPDTTSAFAKSQEKLPTYRNNYREIGQRIVTERQALQVLKQFSEFAVQLNDIQSRAVSDPSSNQVGISYPDYKTLVQQLEASLNQFAAQPQGKKHSIYPELEDAIVDFKVVTELWQAYLEYKQNNAQWLYDDVFNQLVPLPSEQITALVQKYGVKTYSGGTKVSLRFAAWSIWYRASQRIREAQREVRVES